MVGLEVIDSKEQRQDIISFNSNSQLFTEMRTEGRKEVNWHLQLILSSEDSFLLPYS